MQHVWINHDSDLLDVHVSTATSLSTATSTASRATATQARAQKHELASDTLDPRAPTSTARPSNTAGTSTTAGGATSGETIHTTANHPWLTADRSWVAAGDLRPGEPVVTLSGGRGTVVWLRVVHNVGCGIEGLQAMKAKVQG